MTSAASVADLFKGRQFDQEIIVLCVRWYLRYNLSTRDLVEMMAERGAVLVHTTILRWVQRYVPEFEKRWSRYARPVGCSWRCDVYKGEGSGGLICTGRWIKSGERSMLSQRVSGGT